MFIVLLGGPVPLVPFVVCWFSSCVATAPPPTPTPEGCVRKQDHSRPQRFSTFYWACFTMWVSNKVYTLATPLRCMFLNLVFGVLSLIDIHIDRRFQSCPCFLAVVRPNRFRQMVMMKFQEFNSRPINGFWGRSNHYLHDLRVTLVMMKMFTRIAVGFVICNMFAAKFDFKMSPSKMSPFWISWLPSAMRGGAERKREKKTCTMWSENVCKSRQSAWKSDTHRWRWQFHLWAYTLNDCKKEDCKSQGKALSSSLEQWATVPAQGTT